MGEVSSWSTLVNEDERKRGEPRFRDARRKELLNSPALRTSLGIEDLNGPIASCCQPLPVLRELDAADDTVRDERKERRERRVSVSPRLIVERRDFVGDTSE